jgi:O-antigen/teichoic acid export membrane protein
LRRFGSSGTRSAFWGAVDQSLSSLTNVALGFFVARSVSPREFGAFSAVYLTYVLLGLVSRATCSEVLVVRYSAASPAERMEGVRSAGGVALEGAVFGSALSVVVALLSGGALRSGFLALAVCLPGLLLQDTWRFAFFCDSRPAAAAFNDLVWAVVQVISLAALGVSGHLTVVSAILSWGVSAYVSSIVGVVQSGVLPGHRGTIHWWRRHRDLIGRFMAENILMRGSSQLALFVVAALTTLAAFGAIRAANLLLGPLNVLFGTVGIIAIPEGVRMRERSPTALRRLCWVAAAVMSAIAVVVGAGLLVLPGSVGQSLLGDSWSPARRLLVPLTIAAVGSATQLAAVIGLRAMELARRSLSARVVTAPVKVAAPALGAMVAGARGAAFGLAFGEVFGSAACWWQLSSAWGQGTSPEGDLPLIDPQDDLGVLP